ncbi:WcaG Nucleoside-diphosphate-sugar epimerases [actinobacterium SCGC AAA044-D11]
MKKVLITGGAGFIGSHLVDHFIQRGSTVMILDNLTSGSKANLQGPGGNAKFVLGDIRNLDLVEELVNGADVILHMAAALGVDNIMSDTIESISTNIYGSEVVLQAASKFKKRIFIASTSEIYGKNPRQPLSEEDDRVIGTPQNFRWSYSDAKAIEESIARVLFLEKGLQVTTVRFFNTIGPRQTGKYGMVVPKFIKSALLGDDIQVYGDGKQTRVFCHVTDAVDGVISLLNNQKSIGEVFNIGGVGEISIFDLAKKVIQLTDSKSRIVNVPYSLAYPEGYEDMQRRVPNISKMESLTGWKPKFDIDEAILDILKND